MATIPVRTVDPDLVRHYREAGYWYDGGLRSGLERQAELRPDHPALIDNTRTWTYAQVVDRVAAAIATLRRVGVCTGSAVLIVAPVTAPAVVAYLATVRLGAVAVLLDRKCGRSDVQHASGPIAIDAIVADPAMAGKLRLAELGKPLLGYDDLLAGNPREGGWDEPAQDVAAAVFFTSGTTSRPKAVIQSINTLRSGARNMATATGFTCADTAFLSSPVASITGITQVQLALERGGALALEDHFVPEESLHHLIDLRVSIIGGAPVILDILFKQALQEGLAELPLRVISLGGSAIPRDLVELGRSRWGIQPVRIYGSSEASCATYTLPSDNGEARIADDGWIGDGTEIKLDENTGEILVRGPMLFMGYLAEEDNASAWADGGWYRTGDLGRIDGDRLSITGRLKEIVARKGLKISMNEIDEVARGLPGVEEAVSFGVPDAETGERLVLAVYGRHGQDLTFEGVIDWFIDAGLAKWKLPEEIVIWDVPLPRTQTGKVQRRLLGGGGVRHLLAPRLRTTETADAP